MQTINFLHFFFLAILLISSILVIFSYNPVYSVLFLILSFLSSAAILFLFNVDFLGVLFIIIYVGAIAVLFLFVVMMLNIKLYRKQNFNYIPLIIFISVLLSSSLFINLETIFLSDVKLSVFNFFLLDSLSNIDVFGQVLFNYYMVGVLMAGLILLVAMLGAIILTLNFKNPRKSENVIRQLARSNDNVLSYFK
jgi:NADH-quinone oxidoreductase subunit J